MERSFQYMLRMRICAADIVWALEEPGESWERLCNDLKLAMFCRLWNLKKQVRFPF